MIKCNVSLPASMKSLVGPKWIEHGHLLHGNLLSFWGTSETIAVPVQLSGTSVQVV